MDDGRLTSKEALESDRLDDFITQEEARGVGSVDRADLDEALARVIRPPNQNVDHRVLHLPVVRPESELAEIAFGMPGADVNMRRANGLFENLPEGLNVVCGVCHTFTVVVHAPFLRTVLHRTMLVPVVGQ